MAPNVLKSLGAFALTSALCLSLAPSQADARPGYAERMPNGVELGTELGGNGRPCALCHISPGGGGASNLFGQDARNNGANWSALYNLDSDNDGATNGEELCDPMGTFMMGDPAPDCEYTNPSDPQDFPAPVAMDMGMPDMDPPEDMGAPQEDMAPPADMGAPEEDMASPVVDMGSPEQDMGGTPSTDMGGGMPSSDMGGGAPGADMASPGADMSTSGGGDDGDDDEGGCSQSGGSPLGGGMTLLGVLGMLGLLRRRR